MRHLQDLINKLVDLLGLRCSFLEKKTIRSIDLSDLFTDEFEILSRKNFMTDDFKSFSSTDDYNREFLSVFQSARRSFVLDYNQKDGHFRV
ncbi:hypothetical protein EG833_04290 [archaeon]|nr:hypothetical protein [archaeon]